MFQPKHILGTTLIAMAAHVAGAYAANTAADAAPAAADTPTTQAVPDNGAIPEVTVTATKRSTTLQKTPLAITALSAQALDDAHVTNLGVKWVVASGLVAWASSSACADSAVMASGVFCSVVERLVAVTVTSGMAPLSGTACVVGVSAAAGAASAA